MANSSKPKPSKRLTSLDAYRGLVMLAMASGGFAFASVLGDHPDAVKNQFEGDGLNNAWSAGWHLLAYQFSHVTWTGCSFWDLIQPSFMFMVGVSMPFSYAKRESKGQSKLRMLGHAIFRSLILVLLAVFLSSNWNGQTNFIFTNVLAQIGLGYTFVYLLCRWNLVVQLVAAAGILGGYWFYFYQYTIPQAEEQQVRTYLAEQLELNPDEELNQFDGLASHWNKHTNAAAAIDREYLSRFPRETDEWQGRTYWVNKGGYQTFNFIPSIATMLFGLMAGRLLRSDRSDMQKLKWLMLAGGICLVTGMAIDTSIWPAKIPGCNWSFCPIVKRIWSPSWAVFSAGWTFWILGLLYWIIDVRRWKAWAFPLVVVGMNSIAMYCMAQLLKPWISKVLRIHLPNVDALLDPITVRFFNLHTVSYDYLFSETFAYAPVWESLARVFVLWLICLWLYKRKIFLRI
jgi:predicted acyltransferase